MELFSVLFCGLIFLVRSVYCVHYYENEEIWWGDTNKRYTANDTVRPFRIEFDDDMIQDLKHRLNYHRPSRPTFPGVGFEYGFNTREATKWAHYWANVYDFRKREAFLNKFPQFKTNIQGLDIHFIWVRPKVPPGIEMVPLLLLHGWPGSVREFYEAIPLLTAAGDRDFVLEVVVPSLPGFGYSDGAVRPGLSAQNMTSIFKTLMHRLGHDQFYIQGGDWGSSIATHMATLYPETILGYHTNLPLALTPQAFQLMLIGEANPSLVMDSNLAERLYPLKEKLTSLLQETAYLHMAATKPSSIGIALSDSPVGLLSFILQLVASGTKRTGISREDGGLNRYSPDTLIDNLMYYWATNSLTTSLGIYVETLQRSGQGLSKPTPVPTWAIQARYEIFYQSPAMLRTKFPNLLHTTVLQDGGHFLAMEKPRVFADDVLAAISAFRENAYSWRDKCLV